MKATSSKVLLALPTVLLVAATLAVGCTPPPPASSPPVDGNYAPTISSFRTATVPGTSPALVTLAWNVSDRNGEDVTCDIDLDSDGSAEITITACQGKGSRNV
ncbi:MAG TPA: hypothetical protein VL068_08210, partial [Microthrixaceae bacterium]|nr:hypothetical protein [Microthrixaceae bacterium]